MKKFLIVFSLVLLGSALNINLANAQDEDKYPEIKMKIVVQEILNAFQRGDASNLHKYISHEWLDENNIKVNNYKINNYYPTHYTILCYFDRYAAAEIGGEEWSHLLVFKFIDEDGEYRVVPKGISEASNEYIDPWYSVGEYMSSDGKK